MDRVAKLESEQAAVVKLLAGQVTKSEPQDQGAQSTRPADVTVDEDWLREQAKRAEPWLVRLGPPLPGALTTEVGATPVDTSPGKESVASAAETGATEVAKPGPCDEQGVGRAARRTTIARATEVERASATKVDGGNGG